MQRGKPITEQDARTRGRDAGYASAKRAKRIAWTLEDAAAAITAYRKAKGLGGDFNGALSALKALTPRPRIG